MKAGLILLGIVICITLVYYLLFDEYETLFYVNVVSTCLVEIIFLSGIPLFSERKLLTFKNAATWNIVSIMAALFFVWTTFYTLILANDENMKTLYIGQLLLSVVFLILFGVVEIGGSSMQKHEESLQKTVQVKKKIVRLEQSYWFGIKELLDDQTIWSREILCQIRIIFDRISAIPACRIERNEPVWSDLQIKLDELQSLCLSYSKDKNDEELQSKIKKSINSIKYQITLLKL